MYGLVPEKTIRLVYEPFCLAIDGVVKSPIYCACPQAGCSIFAKVSIKTFRYDENNTLGRVGRNRPQHDGF